MNFDPTLRLDFLLVSASVLFFLARLQSKVDSLSSAQERISEILNKLEVRVRDTEIDVAHHLGNQGGKSAHREVSG